jgi:hypothetical protein
MYKIIGADGNQYGPVSLEEIKSWIRDRRANGETLAQGPGMADWKPLKAFPEFAEIVSAPIATQPYPSAMPGVAGGPPEKIEDYLVPAILVTLCCCLPFGIAAIVYAAQANSKKSVGDWAGAKDAAGKAKMWTWLSLIVGGIVGILWIIIAIAGEALK